MSNQTVTVDEEEAITQLDEIMESGQGCGVCDWHREQVKELFESFSDAERRDMVKVYYQNIDPAYIREGELEMINEIIGGGMKVKLSGAWCLGPNIVEFE